MTETRLIDYSYSRPKPADIKRAGYVGVMRYLSLSTGKTLTKTEAKTLHASGLAIGVVWETVATRAGQGEAAGREDHAKAETQAKALGIPEGVPIFYAVDFEASAAKVAGYFKGAYGAAKRHPVGIYAGIAALRGVHQQGHADYFWQTAAWSGGELADVAHIFQRVGHQAPSIPGGGYDENVICRPLPMWGPGGGVVTHRPEATKPVKPKPSKPKRGKHPKPWWASLTRWMRRWK